MSIEIPIYIIIIVFVLTLLTGYARGHMDGFSKGLKEGKIIFGERQNEITKARDEMWRQAQLCLKERYESNELLSFEKCSAWKDYISARKQFELLVFPSSVLTLPRN